MSLLSIRLKRRNDGSAALSCTRADGSVTWQRQPGQRGLVFPAHDLTHYAVETAMGYQSGFYGLVTAGWDFGDFAAPWPRGPIPPEAREVELLVGLFETERRMGLCWTASEFRAQGEMYACAQRTARTAVTVPPLTEEGLARVRSARDELLARWAEIKPGEYLELSYL